MSSLVVGFDLDMTLVDSATGIAATLAAALAEQGIAARAQDVWPLIGLPLAEMVVRLAGDADVDGAVRRYRELYPTLGVGPTRALPGAAQALDAVRAAPSGRVVVVSTKVSRAVHAVLDHVGLAVDAVHGGLFGEAKAVALRQERTGAYVGDHPGDVAAARAAGAVAVAVASGPHPAPALQAAGADVVLQDLGAFPDWLSAHRASRDAGPGLRPSGSTRSGGTVHGPHG